MGAVKEETPMWKKKDSPGHSPQPQPQPPQPASDESEQTPFESDHGAGGRQGPSGGDMEPDPDAIVAELDRLRAQEAALRADAEDARSKYQRSLADFQNYQRRSIENEKEARRQGVTSVVSHLLGVLDNFDLAMLQDPSKASVQQILQGVGLIRTQLHQALAAAGVGSISPAPGSEFDPHRHEAVVQVPPGPGVAPGRIAAVLQVGYTLGERVLRPAKVSVARSDDQGPERLEREEDE